MALSQYSLLCDTNNNDGKLTIKEIISKRYHQKKPQKIIKSPLDPEPRVTRLAKRKAETESLNDEETIKKQEKCSDSHAVIKKETIEEKYEVQRLVCKNGKVQLDAVEDDITEKEIEVVRDYKKLTTSNSFKNINHSEKWTEDETEKFYRALEIFGTDFSLISRLFPKRNRNQIKNKFLKEERISKTRVDSIFKNPTSTKLKKLYNKAHKVLELRSCCSNDEVGAPLKLENTSVMISKIRSDSFHSTSSVDSLDLAIIEDISNMLKK